MNSYLQVLRQFCINIFLSKYFSIFGGAFWFLMLSPGNPTPDGMRSLLLAKSGVIDNWFSIPYGITFYVFTLGGMTIIPLILFQSLVFYLSLFKFLSLLLSKQCRNFVMSTITCTPLLWVFSFTLYHDVLFCSGLFFFLYFILDFDTRKGMQRNKLKFTVLLPVIVILLSMRVNSFIWISAVSVVAIVSNAIVHRRLFNVKRVIPVLFLSIGITFSSVFAGKILPVTSDNGLAISGHIFLADLKCLTYEQRNSLELERDLYDGNSKDLSMTPKTNGCSTIDGMFDQEFMNYVKGISSKDTYFFWIREFLQSPLAIIKIHMQRIWILFPQYFVPPYMSYDLDTQLLPNPPKPNLSSTVFLSVYDLEESQLITRKDRAIYRFAQYYSATFNKMAFLLGSPFLLLVLFISVHYFAKKKLIRSSSELFRLRFSVLTMYAVTSLSTLLATPAPDVRFVYALLLLEYCAVIGLVGKLLSSRHEGSVKKGQEFST